MRLSLKRCRKSDGFQHGFRWVPLWCALISFGILLKQRGDSAMGSEWVHVGSDSHNAACSGISLRRCRKTMGSSMGSNGFCNGVH